MGTGLEMMGKLRSLTGLALALSLLSACGNDPQAGETRGAANAVKALGALLVSFGRQSAGASIDPAALRTAIEQTGKPVISVAAAQLGYADFLAPFGVNGAVETWGTSSLQSVSFRNGIVVATRGLGPDLMTATVPEIAQVRSGSGFFHRVYYRLDGNDQPVQDEFDCTFAANGAEGIEILGKAYSARRITESCANQNTRFDNVYWFDGSGKLRQSYQFVSIGAGILQLQRITD